MPTSQTSPSPPEARQRLRRATLARRDTLTVAERHEKSLAIGEALAALAAIRAARTIFTYVNFKSEVETLALITAWLMAGKEVCVPLTVTAERRLIAYRITDPAQDLVPGYCRIPEPDPTRLAEVEPATIEAIVLPGSVFDLNGGRLGYGGGYYDRFIADQAPQAFRVGLAFELQVTAALPLLAHDQRLHALVTEARTLHFR